MSDGDHTTDGAHKPAKWAKFDLRRWLFSETYRRLSPEERRLAQVLYVHASAEGPIRDRDLDLAAAAHEDDTAHADWIRGVLAKAGFRLTAGNWRHDVSDAYYETATRVSRAGHIAGLASARARAKRRSQNAEPSSVGTTVERSLERSFQQTKRRTATAGGLKAPGPLPAAASNESLFALTPPPPAVDPETTARKVLDGSLYFVTGHRAEAESARRLTPGLLRQVTDLMKQGYSDADLRLLVCAAALDPYYTKQGVRGLHAALSQGGRPRVKDGHVVKLTKDHVEALLAMRPTVRESGTDSERRVMSVLRAWNLVDEAKARGWTIGP